MLYTHKKRKLLIATDRILPRLDGISRFLDLLIPELTKKFEVEILAPSFKGKKVKYKNVKITTAPLFQTKFGKLKIAKPILKKIDNTVKKTDLVFVQIAGPIGFFSTYYAKKNKKKIVNYIHCIEWEVAEKLVKNFKKLTKYFVKKIAKYCYNRSSLLLVPSKQVKKIMQQNKIKTKTALIELGINSAKFLPTANKSLAKKKIGISPENKVIGFVGRIGTLEKDIPTLIKAFLENKKKFPKTKLLLVGEILTNDFPKHEDIIYAGEQKNVVPYLQAMDIFVMPSLVETSSLATREAMSTRCAVISTPVGSIPEYVINRNTGLLFQTGNHKELEKKISYLLTHDNFRKKLGINARQTILERYQWKDTVKKIIKVLTNL